MTAITVSGLAAAAAVAVALQPRDTWRRRLLPPAVDRDVTSGRGRRGLAAVSAGVGIAVVVGGVTGVVAGVAAAVATHQVVVRLEPSAVRRRREQLGADLPPALDLLAACLVAGSTVPVALTATARAIAGPVGDVFVRVASSLGAGASPAVAWAPAYDDGPLAALARAMTRAADSGAPIADVVSDLADDARSEAATSAAAAARRVAVTAVAPLGLCFLPAFVLVAVVPVVASLATGLLR